MIEAVPSHSLNTHIYTFNFKYIIMKNKCLNFLLFVVVAS